MQLLSRNNFQSGRIPQVLARNPGVTLRQLRHIAGTYDVKKTTKAGTLFLFCVRYVDFFNKGCSANSFF